MKKVDLGIFLPIANNGWIISKNAPKNMPTYQLNKEISLLAEKTGYDYVFSMAVFKGFGGETEFMEHCLDSMTLMTALAEATERIKLVATVKPLLIHPAVIAKMAATIDDVSNGRFGMNIVTGYNRDEFQQMGFFQEEYTWSSYRYDYVGEWLDIVKLLWTNESVDYDGKYFQLKNCTSNPKPKQMPYPSIICAGISDKGMEFTVKEANDSFIAGKSFEEIKLLSKKVKKLAKELGRTTRTHTPVTIIQGETDKEAQDMIRHFEDGRDVEALEYMGRLYGSDAKGSTAQLIVEHTKQSVFYGCIPMAGSPQTIANIIEDLVIDGDLDGVLFTFPDFIKGINDFNEKVMPILVEKGLRLNITS